MSWPTASLGDLFDIARGGSPRPIADYLTDDSDGVNWISISDASNSDKYIRKTKRKIKPSGVPRSRIVNPGDFILTNSMSFGRPYIMATSGCIHDGWLSLTPRDMRSDSDYLFRVLESDEIYRKFERLASGATVKNLNIDLVKGVKIPLPPLEEQRRIAAILDQADALRRMRRASFAPLDVLTAASFSEFFGDPLTNNLKWPRILFGNVVKDIEGGWSPTCLDRPATESEWGVLKLGAVTYGRYDDRAQKSLPHNLSPRPALEVHNGDLLFTRKNTHDLVAACALVRETRSRLMFSDLIFRIVLKDHKITHPEYVHALLSHPAMRKEIQKLASGAAGSMPNISKARLRTIKIMLPPLDLQSRFAGVVQRIEALRGKFVADTAAFDALFASLQHRAFRGEL